MAKFLCICLSSTIQKTVLFDETVLSKVNRSKEYRIDASGKAINSARVLSQMQKDSVAAICPIGKKNKKLFLELAKKDNLKIDYVLIPGFTRECLTLLSKSKNDTTEIVVEEPKINCDLKSKEEKFLKLVKSKIKNASAVLFAGSRPACWTDTLIPKIAKLIIENNKIFLADYHSKDLLLTLQTVVPTIIKINDDEFFSTFNITDKDEEILKQKIIQLSIQYQNIIIVTRGIKSTYAANNGIFVEVPIEKITPLNTTACGDSFSAGFLYEFVKTKDFEKSLQKATECASLNAQKMAPGTII